MKHATKKNKLPNIPQKLPILDIVKPIAEIVNNIHPNKFIFLFFIFINLVQLIYYFYHINSIARSLLQKSCKNIDFLTRRITRSDL